MRKKIYVCCGTGIATSTVIAKKLEDFLKAEGIDFEISQYIVSDIPSRVRTSKPDLVVSSTYINSDLGDVPVVIGQSFLTGINQEETKQEILDSLK